jgi:hypothetical protein
MRLFEHSEIKNRYGKFIMYGATPNPQKGDKIYKATTDNGTLTVILTEGPKTYFTMNVFNAVGELIEQDINVVYNNVECVTEELEDHGYNVVGCKKINIKQYNQSK